MNKQNRFVLGYWKWPIDDRKRKIQIEHRKVNYVFETVRLENRHRNRFTTCLTAWRMKKRKTRRNCMCDCACRLRMFIEKMIFALQIINRQLVVVNAYRWMTEVDRFHYSNETFVTCCIAPGNRNGKLRTLKPKEIELLLRLVQANWIDATICISMQLDFQCAAMIT